MKNKLKTFISGFLLVAFVAANTVPTTAYAFEGEYTGGADIDYSIQNDFAGYNSVGTYDHGNDLSGYNSVGSHDYTNDLSNYSSVGSYDSANDLSSYNSIGSYDHTNDLSNYNSVGAYDYANAFANYNSVGAYDYTNDLAVYNSIGAFDTSYKNDSLYDSKYDYYKDDGYKVPDYKYNSGYKYSSPLTSYVASKNFGTPSYSTPSYFTPSYSTPIYRPTTAGYPTPTPVAPRPVNPSYPFAPNIPNLPITQRPVNTPTPVATPLCHINVTPAYPVVKAGSPVKLSWTSTNASYVEISGGSQGTKKLAASGSLNVVPNTNTTYTFKCVTKTGAMNIAYALVTVQKASTPVVPVYKDKKALQYEFVTKGVQKVYSYTPGRVSTKVVETPTCECVAKNYLALKIEQLDNSVQVGKLVNYKITFTNVGKEKLKDVVIKVTLPDYMSIYAVEKGQFKSGSKKVTYIVREMKVGAESSVIVTAKVDNGVRLGTEMVVEVNANYTVPTVVNNEVAYSAKVNAYLIFVVDNGSTMNPNGNVVDNDNSVSTWFSWMPDSLWDWIVFILVFAIILMILRYLFSSYSRKVA